MSIDNKQVQIIILAAGKGSRMKSNKPKVLQKLAGISLLQRLINTSLHITADISIIYGFGGQQVKDSVRGDINWIHQAEQNGTGSAIATALDHIDTNKKVLILYGDAPLISIETLQKMLESDEFSLLTIQQENPFGYGRIIRKDNAIVGIVEQKDTNEQQAEIKEINTGIMAVAGNILHKYIPQLTNNNSQQEYYLTDIVKMCASDNIHIQGIHPRNSIEVDGVNDKIQLEALERNYQRFQAEEFMQNGLTIIDKSRFDNRGNLRFGKDCEIDINTIFIGDNTLGDSVEIGANCQIINSHIADNTIILPNSIIENATIGSNASIGPFARIRPETTLENNTKIGNFVEVKKSTIGAGSKVSHLSYVGDSEIGKEVNIGAGVITCNYDGVNKHKTTIEDGAFVGSNSALIAPVTVETGAIVGAGSTISKTCKRDKITLTRTKQLSLAKRT